MLPLLKTVDDPQTLRSRILNFIEGFSHAIFLESNTPALSPVPVTGTQYDFIAAAGKVDEFKGDEHSLDELELFIKKHQQQHHWIFGYLSYDIKNGIENLQSDNPDVMGFPEIHFFVPELVICSRNNQVEIISPSGKITDIAQLTGDEKLNKVHEKTKVHITHMLNRDSYLNHVGKIIEHIKRGDIYELNYCHQIAGIAETFNPSATFEALNRLSSNPFSAFARLDQTHLICSSPERFIAKINNRIYSQPVKGTAARGSTSSQDDAARNRLATSEKEQSENVMIVDLVRNDLSKIAAKGSVKVDELFGIYTFPRVHQMISTISCELKSESTFTEVIKALFPMGSMTGAPKISAMKIIDDCENFKRGLFSGTIGYLSPDGNFDFNVIIRSILYNSNSKLISLAAGGAITAGSDPELEYDETMLKLSPQLQALGVQLEILLQEKFST